MKAAGTVILGKTNVPVLQPHRQPRQRQMGGADL